MRTLAELVEVVRDRLQAPGPNGGGYTDSFIREALNAAAINLSEVAPVETMVSFTTVAATNEYSLVDDILDGVTLISIFKVKYDGEWIEFVPRNDFFELSDTTEGDVAKWTLWGDLFILIGAVEVGKTVDLYVTLTPARMEADDDTHGLPVYAEEALIHYAVAQSYQVTRDYDRSNLHFSVFQAEKNLVARRASAAQTETNVAVSDPYWKPHTEAW